MRTLIRSTIMVSASALLSIPAFALEGARPPLMAHRGLHQSYIDGDLGPCPADKIRPPVHKFVENTAASVQRAIELGADIVEIDIQSTRDGRLILFHDHSLECKTQGVGVIEDQTFEYLRSLDVGYRYTADNHQKHPLRCRPARSDYEECKQRNQVPELREILLKHPNQRFMLDMKSSRDFTFRLLVDELRLLARDHGLKMSNFTFYSGDQALNDRMRATMPELEVTKLTLDGIGQCVGGYARTGKFRPECHNAFLAVPFHHFRAVDRERAHKLVDDAHAIGSRLGVIAVDAEQDYRYVMEFPIDAIWTDRIDLVGPAAKSK